MRAYQKGPWREEGMLDRFLGGETPCDRALRGGYAADRVGWAFAAGYREALRALVPGLPEGTYGLAATEERGAHPRQIRCALVGDRVRGTKHFATLATVADGLLVLVTAGSEGDRNDLRLVRVDPRGPGVSMERLPDTPFAPEIPHAKVVFDDAPILEILPGDGWTRYVRPFRTVEDGHVHASLLGYLLRVGEDAGWPEEAVERLLVSVAAVRAVCAADPDAPATHVLLAGTIAQIRAIIADLEPLWEKAPPEVRDRWRRDSPLLYVAERPRLERRRLAWERLRVAGA